jgi:hypothetical protein
VPADEPTAPLARALVGGAVTFARRAATSYWNIARRIPGAVVLEAEWGRFERAALDELRRRLDDGDPARPPHVDVPPPVPTAPPPAPDMTPVPAGTAAAAPAPTEEPEPLRVAMVELLLRSIEQTPQRAREYHLLSVLRELLPDEARILAALADGAGYPVVHVERRTGVAGAERLLSNASTVGRAAGVAQLRDVPRYLTRLRRLDLVELRDPDPGLQVAYEILLTDQDVRAAECAAREGGRPRFVRRTLRLSALGHDLWAACHPRETIEASWRAAPLPAPLPAPAVADPPAPPAAGREPTAEFYGRNGTGPGYAAPVNRSDSPP